MIALLAALASAETDSPSCSAPAVVEVLPRPASQDVPLDATIGLVFGESACEDSKYVDVKLEAIDGDGTRILLVDTSLSGGPHDVAWLRPSPTLTADTEYRITLDYQTEVAFATGSRTSAPLEGELEVLSFAARYYRVSDEVQFDASIGAVPNPFGASVVALYRDEDRDDAIASQVIESGTADLTAAWAERRAPDPACVVAVQWDSVGREVAEGERLCTAPAVIGACSTSSGAASSALLALALLAIRRRSP